MNKADFRKKVLGCWLGKAVGGTLGMPFEGTSKLLNLTYYEPIPSEMLPNDDLDLQVLWACVINELDTPTVDRDILADAWLKHVDFPWDEYGVAIRNLKMGIRPPLSGSFDNWFINGMGAAIRSELWACLAPGNPTLAAKYAYEDACVDHASDGIYAEIFLSAIESLAFIETDIDRILDLGCITIPIESKLRQCIIDTRIWYKQTKDWRIVRNKILEKYSHENFTDVVMNLGFIVLGIIAGEKDFSESICIAVNCGMDTDCTGATVGAFMGIFNPEGISERWLKPIGKDLLISPQITGISFPKDLDEFTDMVINLKDRLASNPPSRKTSRETPNITVKPIPAQVSFKSAPIWQINPESQPDASFREIQFDGTYVRFPTDSIPTDCMIVKYRFQLKSDRFVRIFVNTPENCRIWIDGEYAFGRESGRMAPSAHRIPLNQSADLTLQSGIHNITIALVKPIDKEYLEWIIGITDGRSYQWLPDIFT